MRNLIETHVANMFIHERVDGYEIVEYGFNEYTAFGKFPTLAKAMEFVEMMNP